MILFGGANFISFLFAIIGLLLLAGSTIKTPKKNIIESASLYICYLGGLVCTEMLGGLQYFNTALDRAVDTIDNAFSNEDVFFPTICGLVFSVVIAMIGKNRKNPGVRIFLRYLAATTSVLSFEVFLTGDTKLLIPLCFVAWTCASCDSLCARNMEENNPQNQFGNNANKAASLFKPKTLPLFLVGVVLVFGEIGAGVPENFDFFMARLLNTALNGFIVAAILMICLVDVFVLCTGTTNNISSHSNFDVNSILSFAGLILVLKSAVWYFNVFSLLIAFLYLIAALIVSWIQVGKNHKIRTIKIKGVEIPLGYGINLLLGIAFAAINIAAQFGYAIPAIFAAAGVGTVCVLMNANKKDAEESLVTIPCICTVVLSGIISVKLLVDSVSFPDNYYLTAFFGAILACAFLAVLGYKETKRTPQVKIYSIILTAMVVLALLIVPFRSKTSVSFPSLESGNLVAANATVTVKCKTGRDAGLVKAGYCWSEKDSTPSVNSIEDIDLTPLSFNKDGVAAVPAKTGRLIVYTENRLGIKTLHSAWVYTSERDIAFSLMHDIGILD